MINSIRICQIDENEWGDSLENRQYVVEICRGEEVEYATTCVAMQQVKRILEEKQNEGFFNRIPKGKMYKVLWCSYDTQYILLSESELRESIGKMWIPYSIQEVV